MCCCYCIVSRVWVIVGLSDQEEGIGKRVWVGVGGGGGGVGWGEFPSFDNCLEN